MWFLVALIGYFLLAVVLLLDKIVISESRVSPIVYTFYSTIIALPFLFVVPFLGSFSIVHWWIAVASGLFFGLGLWLTFLALEHDEASHIGPFGGALITVFIGVMSFFLLGELLSFGQKAGVATLLFASLLLSYEKMQGRGVHRGFFWVGIAAFCFAISHVSAKFLYDLHPFFLVLFATKGTVGIFGLFCLFSPRVWRGFKRVSKKENSFKRRHPLYLVFLDKFLGTVGVVLIQYAVAIGSVTIVNALSGLQYLFLFFLVVFFTRLFPNVFREYITRREYLVQMAAIVLIVCGSAFLVL